MARKLFAVVNDGTFDGDSAYYCPGNQIPYRQGMSLKQVVEIYRKMLEAGDPGDPEFNEELVDGVTGAWVVDAKSLKILEIVWDSNPGNDSAVYNCNYIAKCIAARLAIKTLGAVVR